MQEKELIKKLQTLKQIKPRQEWVILSKNNILRNKPLARPVEAEFAGTSSSIFSNIFSRQLTYSFAVLLIAVISVAGLMKYNSFKVNGTQSTAALLPEVKSNLEKFKASSKDLALVAKTDPKNIAVIESQVKDAAQALTLAVKSDPMVAKEIALDVNNNKTYLDISSGAKEANANLEKALTEQLYADYEKNKDSLTDEQKDQLEVIKETQLDKGDFSGALVNLLLLNPPLLKEGN